MQSKKNEEDAEQAVPWSIHLYNRLVPASLEIHVLGKNSECMGVRQESSDKGEGAGRPNGNA